ncbi:MAG: ABC-F family ATP-binding cassette domain-containing protein [Lachnospiraceae bacterium]|nr:ABC-F family ATP-binding cassette domain-containing protein [Lachnospiraceae bacterium]
MLLEIKDGTVTRGGRPVLSHFNFEIRGKEKIAIVGKNGAGKTTLLQVLANERPLDRDDKAESREGNRFHTSRKLRVTYVPQRMDLPEDSRVTDLLPLAVSAQKTSEKESVLREGSDAEIENPEGGDFNGSASDQDQSLRARRLFTELGFSLDDANKKISEFSGGEQRKLQLLKGFLEDSDLLILDEPTNHLDIETTNRLEDFIRTYPGALVYVSHDRYFMDETAEVIWEIRAGKIRRYPGNYSSYRKEAREERERQAKAYSRQQEEIKREEDLIRRFKNKAKKAAFARSRQKLLDRMKKIDPPAADDAVIHKGEILPARLGAKWVLQCENLKIGYGKHVVREVDFRIRRGQKIGIIGPNGAGKSTFLKTIAGKINKISGKMTLGNQIDLAYFDQESANLTSERSVHDFFHDRFPAMKEKDLRNCLASYLFRGRDLEKRVSDLSGGEKSRLLLAALLEEKPNFLLLDEPTNHMDIPARETLESIFQSYKGTILFVSHDRYFLQEVATSLLVLDYDKKTFTRESNGDSLPGVSYFPMDYRHYMRQIEKIRAGSDPAALRSAEDQKLIDGLHAVPKRSHIQSRPLTTREETLDWYFRQNKEEREEAMEKLEKVSKTQNSPDLSGEESEVDGAETVSAEAKSGNPAGENPEEPVYMTLEEYMNSADPTEEETKEAKDAEQALTESLIDWYDLWLETPEGREEVPPSDSK